MQRSRFFQKTAEDLPSLLAPLRDSRELDMKKATSEHFLAPERAVPDASCRTLIEEVTQALIRHDILHEQRVLSHTGDQPNVMIDSYRIQVLITIRLEPLSSQHTPRISSLSMPHSGQNGFDATFSFRIEGAQRDFRTTMKLYFHKLETRHDMSVVIVRTSVQSCDPRVEILTLRRSRMQSRSSLKALPCHKRRPWPKSNRRTDLPVGGVKAGHGVYRCRVAQDGRLPA